MEHKPVKSSMLASAAHDGTTLEVTFKNGKTYTHEGVSAEKFAEMCEADSVGKFYNDHIKTKHPGKRKEEKRDDAR